MTLHRSRTSSKHWKKVKVMELRTVVRKVEIEMQADWKIQIQSCNKTSLNIERERSGEGREAKPDVRNIKALLPIKSKLNSY